MRNLQLCQDHLDEEEQLGKAVHEGDKVEKVRVSGPLINPNMEKHLAQNDRKQKHHRDKEPVPHVCAKLCFVIDS